MAKCTIEVEINKELVEKIIKLEEQLKDANRVIQSYIRNNPLEKYGPAESYVNKWGLK